MHLLHSLRHKEHNHSVHSDSIKQPFSMEKRPKDFLAFPGLACSTLLQINCSNKLLGQKKLLPGEVLRQPCYANAISFNKKNFPNDI